MLAIAGRPAYNRPMLDRLDQWLLTRFDLLVGWNRDRGGADQWDMSRFAGEASVGFNVAGAILLAHVGAGDAMDVFARGVLFVSVVAAVLAGRRSAHRYAMMRDGAMRARMVERPVRRVLIVLTAAMICASLDHPAKDDVAVALSLLLLGASIYLKAAVPPPPSTPREKKPKLAST